MVQIKKGSILQKKIFFILFSIGLLLSNLHASVYKGHGLFQKKCLECHGKALEFVIDKNTEEWGALLKNDGKPLLAIHIKALDPNIKKDADALVYFKGKRYPKNVRHFRDFFFEYAAGTGNIPACD